MEDKTPSFFRFEDLRVYGKAINYNTWLTTALNEPRNEAERRIIQQFVTSATDITLNIIEGSSRSKSQFEHYLKISKSAIRECVAYTTVCRSVDLMDENASENSRELLMELTRMIGALIISLQRGGQRSSSTREDNTAADDVVDIDSGIDNIDIL